MNKVAIYLRGHISGEVSTRDDVREAMSIDGGVLKQKPEMVIYPRNTNDIRKVARFSWQLAEKGHKLPITVRGAGTDATGATVRSGLMTDRTARPSVMDDKESLRASMRTLRRSLPGRDERSEELWRHVIGLSSVVVAEAVLVFQSVPGEPETRSLLVWCAATGRLAAVPEADVDPTWPEF